MIQVSVSPGPLVVGRSAELTITLVNTGHEACSDVVFRLKLPPGRLTHVSGPDKITLDKIQAQATYVHRVTVVPKQPGDVTLTTPNFAYRDEHGVWQRDDDWTATIRVLEAEPDPVTSPAPEHPIDVSLGQSKLALGEWGLLDVNLRNATGGQLFNVTLELDAPFRVHGSIAPVQSLPGGGADRRAVSVYAPERGQVLVTVRITYLYQDERGQVVTGSQNNEFTVEVADRPGPPGPDMVTTILYLVAQPRGTEGLRSYAEMRRVDQLLQLGPDRERYRLKDGPATRLDDIGQGLASYKPRIVNFSGHGAQDGSLIVEDNNGFPDYLDPDGLADLVGVYSRWIHCVIVNACHSLILAEKIVKKIEFVVGMKTEINDYASVQFSVGFYQALFGGLTVPEAFEAGKAMLRASSRTNSEYEVPILLRRS